MSMEGRALILGSEPQGVRVINAGKSMSLGKKAIERLGTGIEIRAHSNRELQRTRSSATTEDLGREEI